MSTQSIVIHGPEPYRPLQVGSEFKDDLGRYPPRVIKDRGMVCDCTGLVMYTHAAARQHFKCNSHQMWLAIHGEKSAEIMEDYEELKKEKKEALVAEGKYRQLNTRLEQQNAGYNRLISELEGKLEEKEEELVAKGEENAELSKMLADTTKAFEKLGQKMELKRTNYKRTKKEKEDLQKKMEHIQKLLLALEKPCCDVLRESGYDISLNE